MMAVLQFKVGWAGVFATGRKEIPSMVSVTLETMAARHSALGIGFIALPFLHIDHLDGIVTASLSYPPHQVATARDPRS
jgi:hypothetical protein